MRRSFAILLFFLGSVLAFSAGLARPKLAIPYGDDPTAGAFAEINGIRLYYEVRGSGPAMLIIHGNGGSIGDLGYQIDFFSAHYRVLAADSRGHGKSEMGGGPLTYIQQSEDLNALLEKLHLRKVYVLGWSDGGILGLLLAIHHPDKVARLAIMGANLNPEGAYPWALAWVDRQSRLVDEMIAQGDESKPWPVLKQWLNLLGTQPQIPLTDLAKIEAPTLVMAADKDVIRDTHTLEIFHGIPRAHLAIFPGQTHMIPWADHELFNQTVERFFSQPYTRPDTRDFFGAN